MVNPAGLGLPWRCVLANIGNWTAEFCSTVGGGDLLLSGPIVAGVKFQDSVPAGEVWYSIAEGQDREAGLGIFDGTAKITRSEVRATLVNGVFSDIAPSPLFSHGSKLSQAAF